MSRAGQTSMWVGEQIEEGSKPRKPCYYKFQEITESFYAKE